MGRHVELRLKREYRKVYRFQYLDSYLQRLHDITYNAHTELISCSHRAPGILPRRVLLATFLTHAELKASSLESSPVIATQSSSAFTYNLQNYTIT